MSKYKFKLKFMNNFRLINGFEIEEFSSSKRYSPQMKWYSQTAASIDAPMILQHDLTKIKQNYQLYFYKSTDLNTAKLIQAQLKNEKFEQIILSIIRNGKTLLDLQMMQCYIKEVIPFGAFFKLSEVVDLQVFERKHLGYDVVKLEFFTAWQYWWGMS